MYTKTVVSLVAHQHLFAQPNRLVKRRKMRKNKAKYLFACLALASLPMLAHAQQNSLINRVGNAKAFNLSTDDSNSPFSFMVNVGGKPVPAGFNIDLCQKISEGLRSYYRNNVFVPSFKSFSDTNKLNAVAAESVFMDCGVTENVPELRTNFDFSIPYFISSIKILSPTTSKINYLNDLNGKVVAVVSGSYADKYIKNVAKERKLTMNYIEAKNTRDAVNAVATGRAQALVHYDVFMKKEMEEQRIDTLSISDKTLVVVPFSLTMKKGDVELKNAINIQMNYLIRNGYFDYLYNKWFNSPLPGTGVNLRMNKSVLLNDVTRFVTDVVGN